MRRLLLAFVFVYAAVHAVSVSQQPATNTSPQGPVNETPGNATPTNATPLFPDPAVVNFTAPSGMLIVTVKKDKTADYEAAIVALQEALAQATDPVRRQQAAGWRVFKAVTTDKDSNAIYLHLLEPTVAGADYRPSILLDELLEEAPTEVLAKYREAIASGPNKLDLEEFAKMSVAPVKNVSPEQPAPPKKPGA